METIDVTLQSISNSFQRDLVAIPLRLLFNNKDVEYVLFLGYSRSDVFDIEPVLKSNDKTSVKQVTWLHCGDDPRKLLIGDDEYGLLDKQGSGEIVLKGNTDILIAYLCEEFDIPHNNSVQNQADWKDILQCWWSGRSRNSQLHILASLSATLGKVGESLHLFTHAFVEAVLDDDIESTPSVACNIGMRLNSLGMYEDALRYLDYAIDKCKEYWMPVSSGTMPSGRSILLTAMIEKYDSLVGSDRYDEAGEHLFKYWQVLRGSPNIASLPLEHEVHPLEPEAHYWAVWLLYMSQQFRSNAIQQPSIDEQKKKLDEAFSYSVSAMEIAEKGGDLLVLLIALINHIHLLFQLSTDENDKSLKAEAHEYYKRAVELHSLLQSFPSEGRSTLPNLQIIGYHLALDDKLY